MLKGKTAVITGGVRGIGRSIAEIFCINGADVMLCYRTSSKEAEETAEDLKKYGSKVEIFCGDVAEYETAEQVISKTVKIFGKVDILVNNAGMTCDKLLIKMKPEDFTRVIDVNLNGSFNFMKVAAAVMMKQREGCIINMSSVSGVMGNKGQANYSASKAGIIGMTKSLAKELGRRNIRVNAIAPGFIDTDMTAVLSEEQKKAAAENISLSRIGRPEDVAKTALFLASDMADYITGQIIGVDGGLII